jgi:hypothetical protein
MAIRTTLTHDGVAKLSTTFLRNSSRRSVQFLSSSHDKLTHCGEGKYEAFPHPFLILLDVIIFFSDGI